MRISQLTKTLQAADKLARTGTFLTGKQLYYFMLTSADSRAKRLKIKATFDLYGEILDDLCLKSFLK